MPGDLPFPSFSERIEARRRLWWQAPLPGRGRPLRDAVHRVRERRTLSRRDDPDSLWRCCELWPRRLLDKRNAREFAARHGCDLPELLWSGPSLARAPLERLPARFVVRPVRGPVKKLGYVVDEGHEMLRGAPAGPEDLRRAEPLHRRLGIGPPLLIEELIAPDGPTAGLPLELKCHVFGGEVALLQLIHRSTGTKLSTRFYSPVWVAHEDRIEGIVPMAEPSEPPPLLERALELSARMGAAIGTYMRIDFFSTDRRLVFNEFSSTPSLTPTPFGERLLGERWAAAVPDAS